MKVCVTGASGFIGTNLRVALAEDRDTTVLPVVRGTSADDLRAMVRRSDAVVHLAGVNRPRDVAEFETGNADFTRRLCEALKAERRPIPVAFASSIQAELGNPYGLSKHAAETCLMTYAAESGGSVGIFRLPNVFGKWCRPNYNSVVATFCYNVARDVPVRVDDPRTPLTLVYIDDVVAAIRRWLASPEEGAAFLRAEPTYSTTLGALVECVKGFRRGREGLLVGRVGAGLARALYATYVSYLPRGRFSYALQRHGDARGDFVEVLKTPDSGQISVFTARPGVSRGGHYHHTKTEKLLVVRGKARFRFRHLISGEVYELETSGSKPVIVESIPGWAHDVTNIGEEEMIVVLWANEVFDREHPDTFAAGLDI